MNYDREALKVVAAVGVLLALVFSSGTAFAEPPWVSNTWYINGSTGDDANGGTNPGNDAVKTWYRALQLVDGDSHARVIYAGRSDKNVNDTPTVNEGNEYLHVIADKGQGTLRTTVAPNNPPVPIDTYDTSAVAGIGVSTRYTWRTYVNERGETQAECIGVESTIIPEDYDPAL